MISITPNYFLVQKLIKTIVISLLGMSLFSCSNSNHNNHKQLVKNINIELLKQHKITYGTLTATYDLVGENKAKCIYAKNYGAITNEQSANKLFLTKFKNRFRTIKAIEERAKVKVSNIKDLILKLNARHKFLGPYDLSKFKHDKANYNNIRELDRLDRIISSIPIMMPAYAPIITSHYGLRKHPVIKKRMKLHQGIDLAGSKATPIYAAADGIVCTVENAKGYGNTIEIKHGSHFKTKYAHLKQINVSEGERVFKGQKIGIQGNTGQVTGEHLHYEIWLNNKHLDPFDFIAHACKC
ncbi:MAG: M23 family metallopeptidase [Rickettsiaceae bacterium]|nr:MAG: M23 family metallopeptidase [Rickettsiaceae bacterium]